MDTSCEDLCTFIISRSFLLRMAYVLDKDAKLKIKSQIFVFNNVFPKIVAVYEIMWKKVVEPGMPRMTTWRMRVACWITKATDTHSM